MSQVQKSPAKIRRDFIFFVSGIPDEMKIVHEKSAFVAVGSNEIKAIADISKISAHGKAVENWLSKFAGAFSAAIFRNQFAEEKDGFFDAFEKLSGILDGYAFLIEDIALEICPLALVRQGEDADAKIMLSGEYGWLSWGSPSAIIEQAWQTRQAQLFQKFLIFFDSVANNDSCLGTEVIDQLGLSAKMFRHGRKSKNYGIEFLCKFTALEGLVCGPKKSGHGNLLKIRLASLFRTKSGVKAEIEKLWIMRCEASHQGKAFSGKFGPALANLENIILGVIVFALDHVSSVKTIEELWAIVHTYSLPAEVLVCRPKTRVPIFNMLAEIGKWPNAGLLTDNVFAQLSGAITTQPHDG